MEYCSNCGTKLTENIQFCAECGQPVKQESTKETDVSQDSTPQIPTINEESSEDFKGNSSYTSNAPSEPFFKSKKSKVLTICGLIVIALLIGSYYTIKQMTAPTAVAEGFIEAINKKDAAKMKKYINEGQYEIKVNDQEAKEFITYLHDHPRMITSIAEGLLEDAALYKDNQSLNVETATSPYASIKHKGEKWVLFENYTIQIPTFYTDVTSSIQNTEIYINDKKVGTLKDNNETFGPFLPGEYSIKAVVNGEYGQVDKVQKMDTFDAEDQTEAIDFDWSDHFIYLYSNYDDAILYVNNKSTNKPIGELDEIGPVPLDGSVKLFAQRKFDEGVKKSNVVLLNEGTSEVDLNIDFEETAMETDYTYDPVIYEENDEDAIKNVILQHYTSITANDFSSAYQLFSSARKVTVTLDDWSKGLQKNIEDNVTNLSAINVDGDTATAYIEMTSYDASGADTLVKEWGGTWNLVRESDGWKLDKAELEKLDSRTE